MRSAREHPEAESGLQEAAPPSVGESSQEVTASAQSRANVASVPQCEQESEEGEESEEQQEEQQEEEEEPEPKGVIRSDRFGPQVTCACPCPRASSRLGCWGSHGLAGAGARQGNGAGQRDRGRALTEYPTRESSLAPSKGECIPVLMRGRQTRT